MPESEGYTKHPCQGCEMGYHGCELYCKSLERWNLKNGVGFEVSKVP